MTRSGAGIPACLEKTIHSVAGRNACPTDIHIDMEPEMLPSNPTVRSGGRFQMFEHSLAGGVVRL